MMEIIFSMTLGVALLTFLLIIKNLSGNFANIFLSILFFNFISGIMYLLFKESTPFNNIYVLSIINTLPINLGILTYLYSYYRLNDEIRLVSWHKLFAIPIFVTLLLSYLDIMHGNILVSLTLNIGMKIIFNIAILIYTFHYVLQIEKMDSTISKSERKWLMDFVKIEIIVFFIYLMIVMLWLFKLEVINNVVQYSNLCVALFVFPITYLGLKRNALFSPNRKSSIISISGHIANPLPPDVNNSAVVGRSLLNDEKVDIQYNKLLALMVEEKPYLDESLNIELLAFQLKIHTKHLSHIIHSKTGKSFNDFINEYRIQHFCALVEHNQHMHKTLIALAYESGFASKSSFNRVFKKTIGITPTEYISNRP